jgi:hypothetical protein
MGTRQVTVRITWRPKRDRSGTPGEATSLGQLWLRPPKISLTDESSKTDSIA